MIDYAQLTLPYSSIGMAPYELINGRLPRISFDWNTPVATTVQERASQNKAREIAERMKATLDKGKELIVKA
jgi:hypothetical protein